MIQYYQVRAGKYVSAASQMPKNCRSMAAKYNWLNKNLKHLQELNNEFLENEKLILITETTQSPFRVYVIRLYQENPRTGARAILEIWDNREVLEHIAFIGKQ